MLRKLFKGIAIVLGVLVVLAVAFVWAVLGVNPFEGRVDHLWQLTSADVDFFVRFPGAKVLDEPFPKRLSKDPGYDFLLNARDAMERATRDVARQVDPQIPLGLFKVDLRKDFLDREMAFAGAVSNVSHPQLDHFLFMVRVPYYARFVTALKREFVRSATGVGDKVKVQSGLYFEVRMPPDAVKALRPYRSIPSERVGKENVAYFARIGDVLLFSDDHKWIEDAFAGSTIQTDAWFETEFKDVAQEGDSLEAYVRGGLAANYLLQHGRAGQPLFSVASVVPPVMVGDVTIQTTLGPKGSAIIHFSDRPSQEGFRRIAPPLQHVYDSGGGDTAVDLTENGIGKFIPKDRTVAAFIVHGSAMDLEDLIIQNLSADTLKLIDDGVRQRSGGLVVSFDRLLERLAGDLDDTHLVIVSRPSYFDHVDLTTYDPQGRPLPDLKLSFTLVSRLKDTAVPDKVRETITQNLPYLDLEPKGLDKSGAFYRAALKVNPGGKFDLVEPAYGALPQGMRYVMFSTSPDAAKDVLKAAVDESARLIHDPAIARVIARLPRKESIVGLLQGKPLLQTLEDRVRQYAETKLDIPGWMVQIRPTIDPKNELSDDELFKKMNALRDRYVAQQYPTIQEEYRDMLQPLRALDAAGFTIRFSHDALRHVKGAVVLQLAPQNGNAQ